MESNNIKNEGSELKRSERIAELESARKVAEGRLNERFSELGRLCYRAKGGEIGAEGEALFRAIGEAEEEIGAISAEIERVRSADFCGSCGAELRSGVAFCPHCGARVIQLDAPLGRACAHCGSPIGEGELFCSRCGTRFASEEKEKSEPEPITPQPILCPRCGKQMRQNARFCSGCGYKFS